MPGCSLGLSYQGQTGLALLALSLAAVGPKAAIDLRRGGQPTSTNRGRDFQRRD